MFSSGLADEFRTGDNEYYLSNFFKFKHSQGRAAGCARFISVQSAGFTVIVEGSHVDRISNVFVV